MPESRQARMFHPVRPCGCMWVVAESSEAREGQVTAQVVTPVTTAVAAAVHPQFCSMAQSSLLPVVVAVVVAVVQAEQRAGQMAPAEMVKVPAVASVLLAPVALEESVGSR